MTVQCITVYLSFLHSLSLSRFLSLSLCRGVGKAVRSDSCRRFDPRGGRGAPAGAREPQERVPVRGVHWGPERDPRQDKRRFRQ